MNPADLEMLRLLVLGPANVALPLLLVSLDFRLLLTPEQRARSWPDATLGAAALMVGPLLLPFHFAMTRWVGAHWAIRLLFAAVGLVVGTLLLVLIAGFNLAATAALEWFVLGRVEGL